MVINSLFTSNRAPVLVALALIESGMKYEDAVEFIRRLVPQQLYQFSTEGSVT